MIGKTDAECGKILRCFTYQTRTAAGQAVLEYSEIFYVRDFIRQWLLSPANYAHNIKRLNFGQENIDASLPAGSINQGCSRSQ